MARETNTTALTPMSATPSLRRFDMSWPRPGTTAEASEADPALLAPDFVLIQAHYRGWHRLDQDIHECQLAREAPYS